MDWTGSAQLPVEANVFSNKPFEEIRADFDLSDYIVDDSLLIRWVFEYIKESHNSPKLLPMGQQITLTVSNADYKLSNYFRVGQLGTAFIKWKAAIYYKGEKLTEGLISSDGVRYTEGDGFGHNSHVLTVHIKDWIVEAKDFFSNQPLPHPDEVTWTYTNTVGIKHTPLWIALPELFPGVRFTFASGIGDYHLMRDAMHITYADGSHSFHRSGYQRAWSNGDNKWDWMRKMFNARGWVMESYVGPNGVTLHVRNRIETYQSILQLDVSKQGVFEHSKELSNSKYDMITIQNGTMEGGNYAFEVNGLYYAELKGARFVIMSNKYEENFNFNPYSELERIEDPLGGSDYIKPTWDDYDYKLQKYRNEENERIGFYKFTRQEQVPGVNPLKVDNVFVEQDKILRIDAGSTGNEAMKVNLFSNSVNSPHTIGATSFEHGDLIYNGNYGEMLTREDGLTYENEVHTPQFKANFLPFLNEIENLTMEYEYCDVITHPRRVVTGTGAGSELRGRLWYISALETDLFKERSSLSLIGDKFQYAA